MPLEAAIADSSFWKVARVTGITYKGMEESAKFFDEKSNFKGMAEVRSSGDLEDNYQGVASGAAKAFDGTIGSLGIAEESIIELQGLGLLNKISRNDVKPSVLEFMYGSAIANIIKAYAKRKAVELVDKLLKNSSSEQHKKTLKEFVEKAFDSAINEREDDSPKKQAYRMYLENLKETFEESYDEYFGTINKGSDKKPRRLFEGSRLSTALIEAITLTEGRLLKKGLEARLGDWEDANKALNLTANFIDKMFVEILSNMIPNGKVLADLSKDDINGIIEVTRDLLPALRGVADSEMTALVMHKLNGVMQGKGNAVINVTGKFYSVVTRGHEGPKAGTGAVNTHSLDSNTITGVLNKLYKENNGVQPLNVFDAAVFGGKSYGFQRGYNEEFYEVNRTYSMIEDLHNNLGRAFAKLEEWKALSSSGVEVENEYLKNLVMPTIEGQEDAPTGLEIALGNIKGWEVTVQGETEQEVKVVTSKINSLFRETVTGRKGLFDTPSRQLVIGQMVGAKGTAFDSSKSKNDKDTAGTTTKTLFVPKFLVKPIGEAKTFTKAKTQSKDTSNKGRANAQANDIIAREEVTTSDITQELNKCKE